jgi:hypothetical protein
VPTPGVSGRVRQLGGPRAAVVASLLLAVVVGVAIVGSLPGARPARTSPAATGGDQPGIQAAAALGTAVLSPLVPHRASVPQIKANRPTAHRTHAHRDVARGAGSKQHESASSTGGTTESVSAHTYTSPSYSSTPGTSSPTSSSGDSGRTSAGGSSGTGTAGGATAAGPVGPAAPFEPGQLG